MPEDATPISVDPPSSPITGRKADFVRLLSTEELTRRWLGELHVAPGANFTELPHVGHWRCPDTGLEFYAPDSAAGAAPMYEALAQQPWYYMEGKWEFDIGLKYLKPNDHVLEVGVGVGHFLRAARAKGVDISGLEFNPEGARAAREAGFTVYEQELGALASEHGGSFDCLCSFQVLEHVVQPRRFLEDMIALVKPGGKLVLSVPNADVVMYIDSDWMNLLDQPPHHMSHWRQSTFRALEKHLPLKVSEFVIEPLQSIHVYWYIDGFYRRAARIRGPFGSFFAKRPASRIAAALMNAGLRRRFAGHTLLVVFERL